MPTRDDSPSNAAGGLAALAQSLGRHLNASAEEVFIGSVNGRKPAPIDQWQPTYCGDINMEIRADGTWYHEGSPIRRHELVRLFAGILRREADGDYYLVTPVEKCRVAVELHPLIVTDVSVLEGADETTLALSLNAGGTVLIDEQHPLSTEPRAAGAAYVHLAHGLTALFSRAAWLRLVDMADESGQIFSAGCHFSLL